MQQITSMTNARVKQVVRLRDKAAERRKEGLFVAEGERLTSEVPMAGMEALFITEEWEKDYWNYLQYEESYCTTDDGFYEENARRRSVFERIREAEKQDAVFVVSEDVFRKMSDTQTPQGVLALVKSRADTPESVSREHKRLLFLESLQDPGNIGTMFRLAEAAGAAIILTKGCADYLQPKAVRSSMGTVFRVPAAVVENPLIAVSQLKEEGFRVFAGHLRGKDMYETDLSGKVVFLIGNEGNGLSDTLSERADALVRIPMEGKVESLNAAMSAGLLLYEARRQDLMGPGRA